MIVIIDIIEFREIDSRWQIDNNHLTIPSLWILKLHKTPERFYTKWNTNFDTYVPESVIWIRTNVLQNRFRCRLPQNATQKDEEMTSLDRRKCVILKVSLSIYLNILLLDFRI